MVYDNILIVDDSATSRMIIKRCFEIAGFSGPNFYEAEDGVKAMTMILDKNIDLIVTDLKMPKMDGNTFIKKAKLNEKTKDIPIIVISSLGNDIVEKQLYDLGVTAIIKKPLSPAKVLEFMEV